MKIIIISNTIWNLLNFRGDFLDILYKNKYEILIIAKKDNYYDQLKKYNVKFIDFNFSNKKFYFIINIFYIFLLIFKLKKFNPDIVYSFSTLPNLYSGLLSYFFRKTKFINTFTGLGNAFIYNNIVKKIMIILLKISQVHIYKFFFHNQDDRRLLIDLNIIKYKNSDVVYGSGLNFDKYKRKVKIYSKSKSFLFIGRLIYNKGIIEFINASNKIKKSFPKTNIGVLGEYNSSHPNSISINEYNSLFTNKNIKLHGFVADIHNYNEIINSYDCVVLPSFREGLPKSLIEACYLGKSIISTRVPGMDTVSKEEFNGFQCEPKNFMSLHAAMKKFNHIDQKEFDKFTNNSFKLSKKFEYKNIYNKYLFK
jgi:glycosyltransferase involved in cell wall biosynthesis